MAKRVYLDEKSKLLLIASALTRGERRQEILDKYCKEWDLGEYTVACLYKQAFDLIRDPDRRENIRDLNLARLEQIYQESKEAKDNETALKAINLINKTCNVYTQQIEVSSTDSFEFNFKLKDNE